MPGFINADVENWSGQCDYVLDARDLSVFEDGQFELIYTRQMLEHLPGWSIPDALREWRRVLKQGGVLRISTPDLERVFRGWLIDGTVEEHEALNNIYGLTYPQKRKYSRRAHLTGFTFERLSRLLHEAGFTQITRIEDEKHLLLVVEAIKA